MSLTHSLSETTTMIREVAVVLTDGFVGYFGEYLAMMIKMETRKEKPDVRRTKSPEFRPAFMKTGLIS